MFQLIALGVGVGASLYSGYSAAAASRKNASVSQQYAAYNAANQRAAGAYNANLMMQVAGFNMAMSSKVAELNLASQNQLSEYNAALSRMVKNYDADILMNEVSLLWESADLDITQMKGEFERNYGKLVAGYSASGVELNATDTPALVLMDAETQHEMDVMIVRHGADIQAKKLTHQAAISRWQGEAEARKIMFEGRMAGLSQYMNTMAQAGSSFATSSINAALTRYNSNVQADQTLHAGAVSSYQQRQQANQQIVNGWMNAAMIGTGTMANMGGSPSSPFGGTALSSASRTPYQLAQQGSPAWERTLVAKNPALAGGFDLTKQGTTVLG